MWYRGKDLRVADHVPLWDAAQEGLAIPVFVLDPYFFAPERARLLPHRMQFLLQSISTLSKALEDLGSKLILASGPSVQVIPDLAVRWKVDRVSAHRWSEPFGVERDRRIAAALSVPFQLYEGETLMPPGLLRTQSGKPYTVFTPFKRAWFSAVNPGPPRKAPRTLPPLPRPYRSGSATLPTPEVLGLSPSSRLLPGGEAEAVRRLKRFVKFGLAGYRRSRDMLAEEGTSRLSADLKFGLVSARQVWHALGALAPSEALAVFRGELIWREFTHSTLRDFPDVLKRPFRREFEGFPWSTSQAHWRAWVAGRTGYPVVDAAARQLLAEGYVHNRARMIAASFLTKHLLIDYRKGEAHYLKWLTDGDWAQNNFNWQWSAGCGMDAQPYFRIFNPVLQGKKFDPEGTYVRRHLPELAGLPARFVHAPWQAPASVLTEAGVELGRTYPYPAVDHAEARSRFLHVAKSHLARTRRDSSEA